MAEKLPSELPNATEGVKYAHVVNTGDLTDGPSGTSQRVDVAGLMSKAEYDTADNGYVDKAETLADQMILLEDVAAGVLVYYTDDAAVGGIQKGAIADKSDPARRPAIGVTRTAGLTGETIEVVEHGLIDFDTTAFNVGTTVSLGTNGGIASNPTDYDQQVGVVRVNGGVGFGELYLVSGGVSKAPIPTVLLDGERIEYSVAEGGYVGAGVPIPKAYMIATTSDTITIGIDPDAPNFIAGMVLSPNTVGFSIDSLTGTVKNETGRTLHDMLGSISFQPAKTGGGTTSLNLWSERSADGVIWTQNEGSLRSIEVANNGETFKTSVSGVTEWESGHEVRFRCYTLVGGLDFVSPTATVLGGEVVTGYSALWELMEG